MNKSVSPSRTYMAMCSGPNFVGYHFKKFVLPEKDLGIYGELKEQPITLENDSKTASWYYLNRIDHYSQIDGCISFEDYIKAFDFKENIFSIQLVETQKLLKRIKQDLINGQISDIIRDIDEHFDKYPDWDELKELVAFGRKSDLLKDLK